MLALDFVKANRETVERAIRDKGVDLDLGSLLALGLLLAGVAAACVLLAQSPGKFYPTDSGITERTGHTATLLRNG